MQKTQLNSKSKGDLLNTLVIMVLIFGILFGRPNTTKAFWFSTWLTDAATATTAVTTGAGTASTITDTAITIKNVAKEVLRQTAMTVARRALQEVTKSTVNWINSGFHGAPLFLENPESFFEDIAKSEVKNMVDMFGYDTGKYPFGKAFALNIIDAYKRQLSDNASYSLNQVTSDPNVIKNYQNFRVSGWDGFILNTQYPQNNYVGFQMEATKELAFRIGGTGKSPAQKVQETLQQGMGFLSPKMCPDNPKYNDGTNEFRRPRFDEAKYRADNPYDPSTPESRNAWTLGLVEAKAKWAKDNDCPSGLVNTTPGSVVANQIMTSLSSQTRQSELGAALGNSLSAVFDALLNKFIGDGLNSLATQSNPQPADEDTWSYEGLTLGSAGEGGTNATWDSVAEAPIVLAEFKQVLDSGITHTQKEIQLIDQVSGALAKTWPEARKLDVCIPGPDLGWQDRLKDEMARNSKKLQDKINEESGEKSAEADLVLRELKFATSFFQDWINNKMITELPTSIIFMEAVADVKNLAQQAEELSDSKRTKVQTLARLQAIKTAISGITADPVPGSAQEKTLISLKKQYDAARTGVATIASVDEREIELDIAQDKLENIIKLMDPANPQGCPAERTAKKWGNPGGAISSYSGPSLITSSSGEINGISINSEQAIFCSLPIIGGYNHESFKNSTGITHPDLPMVNAKNVLTYKVKGGFLGLETENRKVDIQMSCNVIYKSTTLDYKGSLPGYTPIIETYEPLPDDTGGEEPAEEEPPVSTPTPEE